MANTVLRFIFYHKYLEDTHPQMFPLPKELDRMALQRCNLCHELFHHYYKNTHDILKLLTASNMNLPPYEESEQEPFLK